MFEKHRWDPSQEVEPPKSEFQKKVHLWMPITKLLPVHPTDHNLTQEKCLSLGNLHAQMYARDQPTTYPPCLHISRATNVKIVVDKVCPCLPVWDAAKNKGFRLYYNEEMPLRKMKMQ